VHLFPRWLAARHATRSQEYQAALAGVTRAGIPVRVGSMESVEFTAPPDATFSVGVGFDSAGRKGSHRALATITRCDRSPAVELASVELASPPPGSDPHWNDIDVDLATAAGRSLTLCFHATAAQTGGPSAEPVETVWFAEPTVRSRRSPSRLGQRPSLIVITLDTTRADHLSRVGYPLPTTPNLDHLAADGEQFLNAVANAPWTLPSHASLFTGLYPREHGARSDVHGEIERLWRVNGIGRDTATLAEQLAVVGYRNAGAVAGPMVDAEFGFARGFDYYDQLPPRRRDEEHRSGEEVTDIALRQVSDGATPFFLFLNYFDPHWPYTPAPDLVERWVPPGVHAISAERQHHIWKQVLGGRRDIRPDEKTSMIDHYDGAIATMDRAIGRLLDGLRERKIYDSTMIVVVSDHGESFGEHRMLDHGHSLYDDVLRVGLIVKYPKRVPPPPPGVSTRRVDLLDVYATICREMGLGVPDRLARFGLHHPPHDHFVEHERNPFYVKQYGVRFDRRLEGIYRSDWKLIRDDKDHQWLFDLATDPLEERNLIDVEPQRAAALDTALDAWAATARPGATSPVMLTPELRQRLRALGYLGD
jgi:arylsulfatase A-like enzyme